MSIFQLIDGYSCEAETCRLLALLLDQKKNRKNYISFKISRIKSGEGYFTIITSVFVYLFRTTSRLSDYVELVICLQYLDHELHTYMRLCMYAMPSKWKCQR